MCRGDKNWRHTRTTKDLEAAKQVIQLLDPKISEQSIRDCTRLGKYDKRQNRPLLIKLACAHESASILGNRHKLVNKPGISIKPDMSKEQRQTQSLLLKERRALIENRTNKALIRIRGNTLYINHSLHGTIIESKFVPNTNPQARSANSQPSSREHSPLHTNSPIPTLNASPPLIHDSPDEWLAYKKSLITVGAYHSLNLIRHTISMSTTISTRKLLYYTLVRSHITFCSQLWHPYLIQDIVQLERIQRKATKYILGSPTNSTYKQCLITLNMLPLMYWLGLQDIMFFTKCIKEPSDNFNISQYVTFAQGSTRSSSSRKLIHNFARYSTTRHFYFNRIVRLWNSLPHIDTTQSLFTIKQKLTTHLWSHFHDHFESDTPRTYHYLCPCNRCIPSCIPTHQM